MQLSVVHNINHKVFDQLELDDDRIIVAFHVVTFGLVIDVFCCCVCVCVFHSMKMIHTLSRHYGTEIRMTNLFQRLTNQMIARCRADIMDVTTTSVVKSGKVEETT